MKVSEFATQPEYTTTFAKICEFPHRARLTRLYPFLDLTPEFNELAKKIQEKEDTIFIVHKQNLEVLTWGTNRQMPWRIIKQTAHVVINRKNDLFEGTLYIYLHRAYEDITIDDCSFERVMIFSKRVKRLILENTTIIYLSVNHCKELEEIHLCDNSRIVIDNMKVRQGVQMLDRQAYDQAEYYPFIDEVYAMDGLVEMPSSDFASSDSIG